MSLRADGGTHDLFRDRGGGGGGGSSASQKRQRQREPNIYEPHPDEVALSRADMDLAQAMLARDNWIRACVDKRLDAIFLHGIMVQRHGAEVTPPPERALVLHRYLIPFMKDCHEAMLMYGLVPVRIVRATIGTLVHDFAEESDENTDDEDSDDLFNPPAVASATGATPAVVSSQMQGPSTGGPSAYTSTTLTTPEDFQPRRDGKRQRRRRPRDSKLERMSEQVISYPVVVKGRYTITTRYNYTTDCQEFRFYRPTDVEQGGADVTTQQRRSSHFGVYDPSVRVLSGFSTKNPTLQGRLQSPLSTLFEWYTRTGELARLEMTAERGRANPLLVTERADQISVGGGGAANQDSSMFTQQASALELNDERLYISAQEMAAVQEMQKDWMQTASERGAQQRQAAFSGHRRSTLAMSPFRSMNETVVTDEHMVPQVVSLLPGHSVVNRQFPQMQSTFLDHYEEWKKLVCAALSIPYTLIQDVTSVRTGSEQHTQTFKRAVVHLRSTLSEIATQFFNEVYLEQDYSETAALYYSEMYFRDRVRQRVVDDRDVQQRIQALYFKNMYQIVLPTLTESDHDDLWQLFQKRTISWQEFSSHARRTSGFQHDHKIESQTLDPDDFMVQTSQEKPKEDFVRPAKPGGSSSAKAPSAKERESKETQ